MSVEVFTSLGDVNAAIDRPIGPTEWFAIEQSRIDGFADDTEDHQWIHVDADRAASGPYGATIAHGFLTLSLLPHFLGQLRRFENVEMSVNYGLDKVRFPSPVKVGSSVRATLTIVECREVAERTAQVVNRVTVEIESVGKPACVAELVSRHVFAG